MTMNTELFDLATECLQKTIPFALYALPAEEEFHFISSLPDDDSRCEARPDDSGWAGFAMNFFANDEPYLAGINSSGEISAGDMIERINAYSGAFPTEIVPSFKSTPRILYNAELRRVISNLRTEKGKIVISQMTAETTSMSLAKVLNNYFGLFPDTFRYVCYLPETGAWMGATPEILIDYSLTDGKIETMALAGTRLDVEKGDWDEKNMYEHQLVADFIAGALENAGCSVSVGSRTELRFGELTHLCTPIHAQSNLPAIEILKLLSPTPAVCGSDREKALGEIIRGEYCPRLCYGGFVAVTQHNRVRAFVNLRCALLAPGHFDNGHPGWIFNIYSGGGITGDSKVEQEWSEAMAKSRPLLRALTGRRFPVRKETITNFKLSPEFVRKL